MKSLSLPGSTVTNALIAFTYAMAAAVVGIVLHMLGAVAAPVAAMVGFCQILLSLQLHMLVLRRRTSRRIAEELRALKVAENETRSELAEQRVQMNAMRDNFENRASAQNKKIVSELKMLEGLMREFAGRISERAKAVAPAGAEPVLSAPRQLGPSYIENLGEEDLLETIRASLEENRVDLYLQPIVSLPQRKLRYYEALSRLRAEDGALIMPAQYIKIAEPVGLMSVVDNLLLFRCVQVVRRLIQRQRDIAVFCNISGDTLTDTEFFPQFLEYMHHNRDLAGRIVFEFAQDALAKAGPRGDENLTYLAGLGFNLSMDHTSSLDLDFARLKKIGFRYIKVRASTLMGGMQGAQ
ncbi:MAG: EAL domain-containing protein, partial [Alphaproteobacteria bacterium]|nr:EAL domain-containing protein [Alphaproteobacteria bacterium]